MHVKQMISWALVIAWMFMIFAFSAQQGSTSGSLSGSIVNIVLSAGNALFPHTDFDEELIHFLIRKAAHFTVYLILGILTSQALLVSGMSRKQQLIYAFLISVLYAASDEFHQSFVPGRGPSIRDVAIDSAGAAVGIALYQGIVAIFTKHRKIPTEPRTN